MITHLDYGNSPTALIDVALSRGLTTDVLTSCLWSYVLTGNDESQLAVEKLLELGVPLPENDDELQFIGKQLFSRPPLFKQFIKLRPDFRFREDLTAALIVSLAQYAKEDSLGLLFQLGFTREQLSQSSMWYIIVTSGSSLLDDWIARDVGLPYISTQTTHLKDFNNQLRVIVTNSYWCKMITYLMEVSSRWSPSNHQNQELNDTEPQIDIRKQVKKMVSYQDIQQSKKLIKSSIRLGFMTIDEWEKIACNKKNQSVVIKIHEALGSLSRSTKKHHV
jgi:hypothetical protein